MRSDPAPLLSRLFPALADSDGYYCTGPGILAFETSLSVAPGEHRLHVLRFSPDGIVRHEPIVLPEFQVHGVTCEVHAIEIEGTKTGCTVDLSDPANPVVTTRAARTVKAPPPNLGHWAKPGVVDLEAGGATGEYQRSNNQCDRRQVF